MSILFSSLFGGGGGGGGVFVPSFLSGSVRLPSGQTGDLLTITPPPGERVKLVLLVSASITVVTGIEVLINGGVIIAATIQNVAGLVDRFCIASLGGSSVENAAGVMSPVFGGVDEVVLIRKPIGNTEQVLYVTYETGVLK